MGLWGERGKGDFGVLFAAPSLLHAGAGLGKKVGLLGKKLSWVRELGKLVFHASDGRGQLVVLLRDADSAGLLVLEVKGLRFDF